MIQLRSAMEKMGKVVIDPTAQGPAWGDSGALRVALDGGARKRLLDWGPAPGRKALLVGAGWAGLAADLAEREMFVTVMEPDPARARRVSEEAAARGLLSRVTVSVTEVKDRSFEVGGFNLVVLWETLARFQPYEPVLEKLLRELKTGGKLFIRETIRVPVGAHAALEAKARRLLPIALSALRPHAAQVIARPSYLAERDQGIDADALRAVVERLFVLEAEEREHALAGDLADLCAAFGASGAWVNRALELDRKLVQRRPELARTVTLLAKKERELGTTFRV